MTVNALDIEHLFVQTFQVRLRHDLVPDDAGLIFARSSFVSFNSASRSCQLTAATSASSRIS